jgi:hypothetical protein
MMAFVLNEWKMQYLGSWSYHGFELDLYPRENSGDLSFMRKKCRMGRSENIS